MHMFYLICQWLLILSLLGFVGTIIWIVTVVLKMKNSIMADAKRVYVGPQRSVKELIATGKGIALQETARVKRVGVVLKGTTHAVQDAAGDIKTVGQSIHPADLQPVKNDVQFILNQVTSVTAILRVLGRLRPSAR